RHPAGLRAGPPGRLAGRGRAPGPSSLTGPPALAAPPGWPPAAHYGDQSVAASWACPPAPVAPAVPADPAVPLAPPAPPAPPAPVEVPPSGETVETSVCAIVRWVMTAVRSI